MAPIKFRLERPKLRSWETEVLGPALTIVEDKNKLQRRASSCKTMLLVPGVSLPTDAIG